MFCSECVAGIYIPGKGKRERGCSPFRSKDDRDDEVGNKQKKVLIQERKEDVAIITNLDVEVKRGSGPASRKCWCEEFRDPQTSCEQVLVSENQCIGGYGRIRIFRNETFVNEETFCIIPGLQFGPVALLANLLVLCEPLGSSARALLAAEAAEQAC